MAKQKVVSISTSYPVSDTHDGIDTGRTIGGAMKEALCVERPVTRWKDSETGEKVDPPDWYKE